MNIILMPAITTLIFAFLCIWKKVANRNILIIIYFFFLLGISYLAHADEETKCIKNILCFPNQELTKEEKENLVFFRERRWQSFLDGMDAINRHSLLISDLEVKKITMTAIDAIMAGVMTRNVTIGALTALGIFVTNSAKEIYDDWTHMRWLINQTEFDLEMYYFYDSIIRKNAELHGEDYR